MTGRPTPAAGARYPSLGPGLVPVLVLVSGLALAGCGRKDDPRPHGGPDRYPAGYPAGAPAGPVTIFRRPDPQ